VFDGVVGPVAVTTECGPVVLSGQLLGHQHRHPITAPPRERDGDEQVIDTAAVGDVLGADGVAGGQVPVHLHVPEHVLLGEGVTLEREAQALPDRAVGPVGTDEVPGPQLRLPVRPAELDRDPLGVLLEAYELDTALDVAAELVVTLLEQPLRLVLG
jgi:hypothetical protein